MTQVLNQLYGFAALGASAIMFVVLCLSYKVAGWLMKVASRRGTFFGVILVLVAMIFSPIAIFIAVIRDHSLIKKTVLAIFIITSIVWGFMTVTLMKSFIDHHPVHSMEQYYDK